MNLYNYFRKITPNAIWSLASKIKYKYLAIKYLRGGRPRVAAETSKAKARRIDEGFFEKYCNGKGLDIGFGGDLITPEVDGWDFEHGDAQYLSGIKNEVYDFVYSSHTLEHVNDEEVSLVNWFRVLKKGGYLILYLPHRDLYEKKKTLPSKFNPTHKRFFMIEDDELPDTIGILPLLNRTLNDFELIYIKKCDNGFTITDPNIHSDGEYSIEAVIRKIT